MKTGLCTSVFYAIRLVGIDRHVCAAAFPGPAASLLKLAAPLTCARAPPRLRRPLLGPRIRCRVLRARRLWPAGVGHAPVLPHVDSVRVPALCHARHVFPLVRRRLAVCPRPPIAQRLPARVVGGAQSWAAGKGLVIHEYPPTCVMFAEGLD
jgi:hypothetical protein